MLVTVESGRATRVAGDPDHPVTHGFLCAKVNRYVERTYHRDRLLYPMRRVGAKGAGRFERISWDEALTEIAERLNAIRASADGAQGILPYSYAGTMGLVQGESMDRRLFHTIGASKLDRTICSTAGGMGMKMTVGANIGADIEGIPDSDLILLWARTRSPPTRTSGRSSRGRGRMARRSSRSTRSARARRPSATSGSPSAPAPTRRSHSA